MTGIAGFEYTTVEVGPTTYRPGVAGSGPAVLLLHGFRQTHFCWHLVAPAPTARRTVVVCDLKGYGESRSAPGGPLGEGCGNRERAAEPVELMARLGFERFAVVGHDRGGRVAYRMALDHPAIAGMCAGYRASFHADRVTDAQDRDAGRRIACPVLVHWGAGEDAMSDGRLPVWRRWADAVEGGPLPSGHFIPEEAPGELAASLRGFLAP